MKKMMALVLAAMMVVLLAACGDKTPTTTAPETTAPETTAPETTKAPETTVPETTADARLEGVMTYAEYAAAELKSEVKIVASVQATQSWWNDQITVYAQDEDGAYFLYNMPCKQEDAAKLVPGTKIVVTGVKDAWAGEVEVTFDALEATHGFEFLDEAGFTAEPADLTDLLADEKLIDYQNQLFTAKGLVVEDYDGTGAAFAYKDAVGKTDDLYFKLSKDGKTYDFCVEFYLCGQDSDAYKAVEALKVGDIVDVTGFLYWYNGMNPHTTGITVTGSVNDKAEGVMSYAEYAEAEIGADVVIETYVQAHQSWWDNKITVYTQDADGAYFLYEMPCSEEDAAKLVPGTKIKVTGVKSEWSGEVEVTFDALDAAQGFEIEEGSYIAPAKNLDAVLVSEDLIKSQNQKFALTGLTVADYDGKGAAFAYKDEVGKSDDLYFKVTKDDKTYDFCVEFYLCGKDTDVYKAVEGLKVGDVIDVEGFLYWYNGANPHITAVTVEEVPAISK